jgi:hypothetical protein
MQIYRCYFRDRESQIRAARNIQTNSLAEAIDRARAMLMQRPDHQSVEIWQGGNRVYPPEAGDKP